MKFACFRYPHTQATRRAAAVRPDGEPPVRRVRDLRTAYDDINVARNRTWKAYRKTQYRAVAA